MALIFAFVFAIILYIFIVFVSGKDLNKIKIIDNPDKLFTSILNNFLILDKESKTIFKSELRKSIIKDNYTKSIFYNKLIKSKITDNQNNYIKISKV